MKIETVSENVCFGGRQGVYKFDSRETGTPMQFAAFVPKEAANGPVPVLWYLSGLTCTEENFTVKAGAQRVAAEHGIMLVAPDTSPRGANIDGEDESYDFGTGAGFYVDATQSPWATNYRMYSHITAELPGAVFSNFNVNEDAQGITGHSMGGHGALTIALKNPDTYKSVSAFSPIVAPTDCPWGQKALTGYLGDNTDTWAEYDATRLVQAGNRSLSRPSWKITSNITPKRSTPDRRPTQTGYGQTTQAPCPTKPRVHCRSALRSESVAHREKKTPAGQRFRRRPRFCSVLPQGLRYRTPRARYPLQSTRHLIRIDLVEKTHRPDQH